MLKKIFFALIVTLCFIKPVVALDVKQAEQFMREIGDNVINLIRNQALSHEERAEKFKDILETRFNLKAIGKFVLGRYWKEASEEEKKTFLELFKATSIATYTSRFQDYTGEKFEITGSREEKDGGIMVFSQITRPNGQQILIHWKIFEKKGGLRIYDVILEGISMGLTQRSEFAAVIQKGGGKMAALLQALAEKAQGLTHKD